MGHCRHLRMWSDYLHDLFLQFSPPMVVKGSMDQGVYGVNSTYNVERCGKNVSSVKGVTENMIDKKCKKLVMGRPSQCIYRMI